jgi:hypothetical protein
MAKTIIRTIEDDLKSVLGDQLPQETFFKRLLEHFVFVPTPEQYTDGRFNTILLAGEGDEGMFLPVFTSHELFAKTPLAQNNETARVPFDLLMRKVSPDTGLAINPFTDAHYPVRWLMLQEYIPEFGADFVKQEVTPEWLLQVNAEFTKQELPHGQRAFQAIRKWGDLNGMPISMSSLRAKKVFEWFSSNIKPGSDWIGPLATAAFYHDSAFWETTVPLCHGRPPVTPLDMLRMPASVKLRFCNGRNDFFIFLKFFADLWDYYYTVDDVRDSFPENPLLKDFIAAGREHLTLAGALLLETNPNPKGAEASRFALEIFLKIFLIHRANVTEKELRTLGHDLNKLLKRCLEVEPSSDLRHFESKIVLYPGVSARYRVDEFPPKDLWTMYYTAVTSGAVVMRPMSDRDFSKAMGVPKF